MQSTVFLALIACTITTGCATTTGTETTEQTRPNYGDGERTILRVAMFPYLPGLGSDGELAKLIEERFEDQHPDIDLELSLDPGLDFYDPFVVAGWLRSEHSDGSEKEPYDLVEIDTVLLGTLVDMEAVAEWPHGDEDLIQIGYEASIINGRQYGVPHWLCGHFIVTAEKSVAAADTVSELALALEALDTPRPNMVGNLLGSWHTAALYIDAWADARNEPDPFDALRLPLDTDLLKSLSVFAELGQDGASNPCIDGTFDDWQKPGLDGTRFGEGKADALFGYSERVYYAQAAGADPSKLFVSSAAIGEGSDPLWFVDIWVRPVYDEDVTPLPVQAAKREAAERFVAYINAPDTFEWMHLNAEAIGGQAVPRYLIPATVSAFQETAVGRDPIMSQIWSLVDQGTFFPQHRLPGIRRQMGAAIEAAWGSGSE